MTLDLCREIAINGELHPHIHVLECVNIEMKLWTAISVFTEPSKAKINVKNVFQKFWTPNQVSLN